MLLAALAAIIVLIAAATSNPYLSVDYRVSGPGSALNRTDAPCPTEAAETYFLATTPKGRSFRIHLCLLTMPFGENHQQLVPYKIDQAGMVWGNTPYSDEVRTYESNLEAHFASLNSDTQWADDEISRRYRKNFLQSVGYLAFGLGIFWVIVWAIGWIVRGFAGIPLGKDTRSIDA